MAIKLGERIKNVVLEKGFKQSQLGDGALSLEAFDGNTSISDKTTVVFGAASDGKIDITFDVDIDVDNAEVNKIKLFYYSGASQTHTLWATFDLEEDEIKDFSEETEGGIYRVKTFELEIKNT